MELHDDKIGVSSVIAILILVGVLIIGVSIFSVFLSDYTEQRNDAISSDVSLQRTEGGVRITAVRTDVPLDVIYNRRKVITFNRSEQGRSFFIPTQPGDEITVIANIPNSDNKVVEEYTSVHIPTLIASYNGDNPSSNITDASENKNNLGISGEVEWVENSDGTAVKFERGDFARTATVNDGDNELRTDTITIIIEYRITSNFGKQQLLEFRGEHGNEFRIETNSSFAPYSVEWGIENTTTTEISGSFVPVGEKSVAVVTYDNNTMRIFSDGKLIQNVDNPGISIEKPSLSVGVDSDGSSQFIVGEIYSLRVYNTEFSIAQVQNSTTFLNRTP